jgi:type VI secretion system secreted protein Hcp
MDSASADLLKTALKGDAQTVTLKFTRTDTSGSGGNDYLTVKMEDVILSGYSVSSGGDMPTESLSLNYAKVEFTETPMDDTGKAGTPVKVGFDLATMKLS